MSNPPPSMAAATASAAFPSAPGTVATSIATRPAPRKRTNPSRAAATAAAAASSDVGLDSVATRRREQHVGVPEEDAFVADSADSFRGKDVNHTVRGEAVLETTRTSKKEITTTAHRDPIRANLSLNLHRKSANGTCNNTGPKSVWQLLNLVLTRSLLLFILVAGLGTTYLHWSKPQSSPQMPTTTLKVAELEHLLKKTTKMMQVQLDLVDMKIMKEVEGLRNEMEEKIGEQTVAFGTELRNVKAKMDDIETVLARLTDSGVPTRRDVEDLVNSIVGGRTGDASGEVLTLDDVRRVARTIIEAEIEKHSADGIAKVDYALGTGGGKVLDHSEGYFIGRRPDWSLLALSFLPGTLTRHPSASKILEPSFGEPGQCLPLKGSNVYVDIALRTAIFPEAVTVEHVSKSVAYDISSAPKTFRVFGWLDSYKQGDLVSPTMMRYLLGEFTYNVEKTNVQTFSVLEDSTHKLINMVKFEVLSNYGSSTHTCIYRFRVHGSDPLAARSSIL